MAENEEAAAAGAQVGDAAATGDAATADAATGDAATGAAATGEAATGAGAPQAAAAAPAEEITYHAVEKDGQVTAIWEMQGRKHLRTIDPRSRQGQEILRLYTAEHEQQ
ncbi:MAG TPA: hypothetical protein VF546_08375 [Pyrinomonadaceae bacterium]|jgi:hypothetical protein